MSVLMTTNHISLPFMSIIGTNRRCNVIHACQYRFDHVTTLFRCDYVRDSRKSPIMERQLKFGRSGNSGNSFVMSKLFNLPLHAHSYSPLQAATATLTPAVGVNVQRVRGTQRAETVTYEQYRQTAQKRMGVCTSFCKIGASEGVQISKKSRSRSSTNWQSRLVLQRSL